MEGDGAGAPIVSERRVLEACQLLYGRFGRPPKTLVLHPADWIGLRRRLERGPHIVPLGEDRVKIGPFDLAVVIDPECARGQVGLLYGPSGSTNEKG